MRDGHPLRAHPRDEPHAQRTRREPRAQALRVHLLDRAARELRDAPRGLRRRRAPDRRDDHVVQMVQVGEDLADRARLLRRPRLRRGGEACRTSASFPAAPARARVSRRAVADRPPARPRGPRRPEVENECVSACDARRRRAAARGIPAAARCTPRSRAAPPRGHSPSGSSRCSRRRAPRPGCRTRAPRLAMARACAISDFGGHRGRQRRLQRVRPVPGRAPHARLRRASGDQRLEVGPVHLRAGRPRDRGSAR